MYNPNIFILNSYYRDITYFIKLDIIKFARKAGRSPVIQDFYFFIMNTWPWLHSRDENKNKVSESNGVSHRHIIIKYLPLIGKYQWTGWVFHFTHSTTLRAGDIGLNTKEKLYY